VKELATGEQTSFKPEEIAPYLASRLGDGAGAIILDK